MPKESKNFESLNEEEFQKELEEGEEVDKKEEEKESEEKTESQKGSAYQSKWPEHFSKQETEERKTKLDNPNWFREQE